MALFLQNLRRFLYQSAFRLAQIFPVDQNKIVLNNMGGKGYGDSPKAIAEYILAHDYDFTLVWLVAQRAQADPEAFPKTVKQVRMASPLAIYHLATARFWISNIRFPYSYRKRKNQIYFQLWHGGIGIKRVEKDVQDKLSANYIASAKADSRRTDYFVSGSRYTSTLFRNAFWYDGPILELGCPRNDLFFTDPAQYRTKVHQAFDLDESTRIVLYAPTFRNDGSLSAYDLDLPAIQQAFAEKWQCPVCLLVRLHPNIAHLSSALSYTATIRNASVYPDMTELLIACDALISDYSSSMFDSLFLKTPVFMYANDLDAFLADRGSYFDLKSLPFHAASNQQALLTQIRDFDFERYQREAARLKAGLGIFDDGHATQRLVETLVKLK